MPNPIKLLFNRDYFCKCYTLTILIPFLLIIYKSGECGFLDEVLVCKYYRALRSVSSCGKLLFYMPQGCFVHCTVIYWLQLEELSWIDWCLMGRAVKVMRNLGRIRWTCHNALRAHVGNSWIWGFMNTDKLCQCLNREATATQCQLK